MLLTNEINIRDPFVLPFQGIYYLNGTRAATCWRVLMGLTVIKVLICREDTMEKNLRFPDDYFFQLDMAELKYVFTSGNYFKDCFRKHFGISPSRYRKNSRIIKTI